MAVDQVSNLSTTLFPNVTEEFSSAPKESLEEIVHNISTALFGIQEKIQNRGQGRGPFQAKIYDRGQGR